MLKTILVVLCVGLLFTAACNSEQFVTVSPSTDSVLSTQTPNPIATDMSLGPTPSPALASVSATAEDSPPTASAAAPTETRPPPTSTAVPTETAVPTGTAVPTERLYRPTAIPAARIYWGANIDGAPYGFADAPFDTRTLDAFEAQVKKKMSIVHWGQPWWHCYQVCGYQQFSFQVAQYDKVRSRGAVPLVDWSSFDFCCGTDQPQFSLATIVDGTHDAYIRQWATEAKGWGHPFFLRFDWEMNGNWFAWSEGVNRNRPGEYIQAWRHVHDIFTQVGASNVTWVWCVNADPGQIARLDAFYPGERYVDWTCADGYNWGTVHPTSTWSSFPEVFGSFLTWAQGHANVPIMLGEWASVEDPNSAGRKASWLDDARAYVKNHPQIQALSYFDTIGWDESTDRSVDWRAQTSSSAYTAFKQMALDPYFGAR
jgi:hypothetical protein